MGDLHSLGLLRAQAGLEALLVANEPQIHVEVAWELGQLGPDGGVHVLEPLPGPVHHARGEPALLQGPVQHRCHLVHEAAQHVEVS